MKYFADVDLDDDTMPGEPISIVAESWQPIDLADVMSGGYVQPIPTVLHRDDRQALFYAAAINGLHGQSGEGKGWIACQAIVEQLARGRTVVLIDLEDNEASIVARLKILGATDAQLVDQLVYLRPADPFTPTAVEHLRRIVTERQPSLVIIDSLGEAFGLDGIDENADSEVGPWLRRVARPIAELGPAVVLVDHSTKANDNPLFPSGSKRKRAAIGGASYLVTATSPFVKGTGGRLKLTCAKDRHGNYARSEHVADFVMTVDPAGTHARLYAPHRPDGQADLPVELAAKEAVRVVTEHDEPLTLNALVGLMQFRARRDTLTGGIDLAVSRGQIDETKGPRNSRLFTLRPASTEVPA